MLTIDLPPNSLKGSAIIDCALVQDEFISKNF